MVLVDGHDVNLEQVCAGMAWWYRQYAKEQAPADRQLYDLAENEARAAKRGLWGDPQPTPSWEWRRKGRDARSLAMTALPTPAVLHPLLVEADASPGYVDEMALADKLTAAMPSSDSLSIEERRGALAEIEALRFERPYVAETRSPDGYCPAG